MTVDEDWFNVHDLDSGDLDLPGFEEFSDGRLCVPSDSLEDFQWGLFPCFADDSITSNQSSFCVASDDQPTSKHERWVGICEDALIHGFTKKKMRTKKNYKAKRCPAVIDRKRCSHCKTAETPQWRNGPNGPKTLCNACGVRFKSGRLLPEYRPAASPTFDERRHSNYHKKIMEKRGLD